MKQMSWIQLHLCCSSGTQKSFNNSSFCPTRQFQVLNPDNTPAEKVELVVEPGNVMLLSGANGFTKLSVNTQENTQKLAITVNMSLHLQNDLKAKEWYLWHGFV